jgi:hypothetical protein
MRLRIFTLMLCVVLCMSNNVIYGAETFKDASSPVKSAVADFTERGILQSYINKYGADYFHPTTTITREDLLLTLYEYDRLVKTLMNYRSQMSTSINALKQRIDHMETQTLPTNKNELDPKQNALLTAEIERQLPAVLQNTSAYKKTDDRLSSFDRRIAFLEAKTGKSEGSEDLQSMVRSEVKRALNEEKGTSTPKQSSSSGHNNSDSKGKVLSKIIIGAAVLAAVLSAR